MSKPHLSFQLYIQLYPLIMKLFQESEILTCSGVACKPQNSQFQGLIHSMVTLFWTNMGIADLSAPSVNEDHEFTKMVAVIMFVVYHIISIVILLNMLIAMMNLSYDTILGNSDVEWKFARAKVK